jgi:polysaccharide biosynthesis/export protein
MRIDRMTATRIALTAVLALLAAARPSRGQAQARDPAAFGLRATRQALEERAQHLEQTSRSSAVSQAARDDAAREAAAIRARLTAGDFVVGDRVLLAVEGEKELSDTFTVAPGRLLALPLVGDVSLEGVLRSELQPYLARRLSQNLREPVVRARPFVRVSIQGAVARPGFYPVPAEALLSDALMAAGGTDPQADMKKLRIERAGQPIWQGPALQQAMAEGRTLDEAGLIAGDQYVVPRHGATSVGEVLRFGAFLLSIPVTIFTLTKLIH